MTCDHTEQRQERSNQQQSGGKNNRSLAIRTKYTFRPFVIPLSTITMASKSWIMCVTLFVGCSAMNVADAFLPLSGIAGIGFFRQAKRTGGIREFMPRKDAKHIDHFHSIMETAMDTTVRMAERAALMTEPFTSATTRFLMDRVGDPHHQLLDKTIGEMKTENQSSAKTSGVSNKEKSMKMTSPSADASTESLTSATGRFLLNRLDNLHTPQSMDKRVGEMKGGNSSKENTHDVQDLSSTSSRRAALEDVWGDNAPAIQAASEQFQKDLRAAKNGSKKDTKTHDSLAVFANASLGLTAPLDLLKDDELKEREQEAVMADERAQKRARIAREQAELRDLMKHIQHASMEKKQRAKEAKEKGSFPVILAALAESDSEALKKPEPEMFERGSRTKSSGPAIGQKDELTFEQLNKQIRIKYEQEKLKQRNKRETIVVVKKLERDSNNRVHVGRAALRFIKRSLNPLRAAVSK